MKKLSISLLVMLLIASLFTSCSMGSDDASDVRVKVRLTPSGGGRSLTTDIETINLDDDSITWHYSATKESETKFNYGATSDSILPKDGIVTLSQGDWTISLRGFKDGKKVYAGTTSKVTIKWNFYEPNVTVPVPVKQNTGDNGYIVLNNVLIYANDEYKNPNYASIVDNQNNNNKTEILNLNGANMRIECAPGAHTITFEYRNNNSTISSKSLVVTVVSGRETTISGNIEKGEITNGGSSAPTSDVQVIEVKKEAEVKVETSVAPATTSTPGTNTTVTFPAGSFNDDSSNAVLNLSVKSAGSEFSVTSSGTSVPVAGIDISLKVNNQEVTSFNGKEVVIETYIAKNLNNVSVKYNGTDGGQPTDVVYDIGTGKLVFKTTHFSEYYVLADEVEAYNTKQNKVYAKLKDAINDVSEDKSNIVLLKDISQNETINIPNGKNLILDLNGHTLTVNGTAILNNGTLEIKNGTVVSKTNVAICVGNASKTTIESGNYIGQEGAVITGYATGATININGGTFTAIDNAVISGNGKKRTGDSNTINISGGTFNGGITSTGYVACGIYAPWKDNINVSGGTFNITGGAGIVARAGNVNVTGGTFNCTGSVTGKVGDSRVVVPCSTIVFDSEANYPAMTDESKITISGGSFKTDSYVNCITFVQKTGDTNKRIEVSGGSFTDIASAMNYSTDGAIIKLASDVLANGSSISSGKNVIVDFGGHTYTLNKPGAGSTNTETNGFQLLKGSTITFKNGTITISEENKTPATDGRNIQRIIQNYSNLTLENMTIDGTNQYGGASYVMSFNNDPVTISGNTNIIGEEGKIVFDADGNWSVYNRSRVTIDTTGTITGDIEVGRGYLTIINANVVGGVVPYSPDVDKKNRVSITGGTFMKDPSVYVKDGYKVNKTDDVTWTVSKNN
ncbi:carbohydrate-binding domain-containing protein [Spirochaetales bacterium NM-380-WT-3C1]|uniref:Carbohydrate-binding domain-containing protein n=1 Tax=Bullifex porci TaxID=2606638 RepID=A0A7X2PAA7_9SPIO|nr:hypothetical protein [Bullifex porci]MSU05246.1 carbohydrate-binding domain-containing protein [Bullifex porci]